MKRKLSAILFASCAVLALSGCVLTQLPLPGAYDEIEMLVDDVDPSSLGDVLYEDYFGGGYVGDSATYLAMIEDVDAGDLSTRLGEANFELVSEPTVADPDPTWQRESDGLIYFLTVRSLEPGDTYRPFGGERMEIDEATTVLILN